MKNRSYRSRVKSVFRKAFLDPSSVNSSIAFKVIDMAAARRAIQVKRAARLKRKLSLRLASLKNTSASV